MSSRPSSLPSRNTVSTIRADGSRSFVYPADAHGRFARLRQISAFALIAFYLSLPWIKINGFPAVFINVAERRFHLFGITLAAQDLWLLFFLITGLGFSLFFVTALLGRVWCGWACPQTVFLDHVYRRIERWVEGDAVKRRALAAAPLSGEKVFKRVVKHTLYVIVSAVITHLFLAYFVSLPEVWSMVRAAPGQHWSAFAFIAVATGILYFNFAWFREQMCIVICPYGRIQSALIDDHSLVIGYDARRGEPRGPRSSSHDVLPANPLPATSAVRSTVALTTHPFPSPTQSNQLGYDGSIASAGVTSCEAAAQSNLLGYQKSGVTGDCVACNRCVAVCPTGIDIRHGLQMECIGCTACIDACDDVMTKLKRPRGLIRYDSQRAFTGGEQRWIRPRTILYGVLLLVGASVCTWALSTVKPANVTVTRMTGAPYIVDDANVRNQFLVRLVNKRMEPVHFVVSLVGGHTGLHQSGFEGGVDVGPLEEVVQPLVLQQPRSAYTGPFEFEVSAAESSHGFKLVRRAEFLGPEARLLREEERQRKP